MNPMNLAIGERVAYNADYIAAANASPDNTTPIAAIRSRRGEIVGLKDVGEPWYAMAVVVWDDANDVPANCGVNWLKRA